MQKIRKRRAIIIGGSLGGLLAVHQLRSIGWDVDVYERTGDDLADRGQRMALKSGSDRAVVARAPRSNGCKRR